MELAEIIITCPITWFDQIKWLEENCQILDDYTNWAAWNIGIEDIRFLVSEKDATLFYLTWSKP